MVIMLLASAGVSVVVSQDMILRLQIMAHFSERALK